MARKTKEPKKTKRAPCKKKTVGKPVDVSGVAGGKDWSNTLEARTSKTMGDF